MKLFDLTGKVAIVTGGNGGVGGMATGLASCGATIVIAARDANKASISSRASRQPWTVVMQ
jgi:2-dehydro-3-deoxy-D-gluconate 5-dehydrogenase